MALGESYEEYTTAYYTNSLPVKLDMPTNPLIAIALVLTAFVYLTLAFLGGKKQSSIKYTFYALVASLSIGLGSIYVSNTVGVYV